MALIKCPECNKEVSDKAEFCPKCGYDFLFIPPPVNRQKSNKKQSQQIQTKNEETEELIKELESSTVSIVENIIESELVQDNEITTKGEKVKMRRIIYIAATLLLVVSMVFSYFYFYIPYKIDKNAKRVFTYAENSFLRSTPVSGLENNKISTISYSTELKVFKKGEFSLVKTMDGVEGFLSSSLLLDSADFYRLHGIWGDNECRKIIKTIRCRKALLDYYKQHDYYGYINSEIAEKLYPNKTITNDIVWQVFCNSDIPEKNLSTYYGRVYDKNSKYTDFGVIIKNSLTGKRIFLLFTFTDDEQSNLILEEDCPDIGNIQTIFKAKNGIITVKYQL